MSKKNVEDPVVKKYFTNGKTINGTKEAKDTWIPIYDGLLKSKAMLSLNNRQRYLYIVACEQRYKTNKPISNKEVKENLELFEQIKNKECFYLPYHNVIQYMKQYEKNSGRFMADMKVLIEHGLIDKITSGKSTRTNNIYAYSDKWKYYQGEPKPKQAKKIKQVG